VDRGDAGDATIERRLVGLDEPGWDSGIEQRGGDAGAHRARADHRRPVQRPDRSRRPEALDLAGRALGEEGVAQALRLGRRHQLDERLSLECEPSIERLGPGFEDVDGAERRGEWRPLLAQSGSRLGAQSGEVRLVEPEIAGAWGPRGRDAVRARQRDRGGHRIAVDHLIEQPSAGERRGHDRLARDDHLDRALGTGQARQPLRAAGAGHEPELDLR
jgi:hypothetical protein